MAEVLETLVNRVRNHDSVLADALMSEIKKLQNRRTYGLVYESHAPEGVRLWDKKVAVGDVVHVLPPRGVLEKKENYIEWKVVSIKDSIVHVVRKADDGGFVEQDVSADDVVAFADF